MHHTNQSEPPVELENLLCFERLLAELSAQFINLPTEAIDGVITESLQRIAETLDLDRATLGEVTADGQDGFVTHCYHKPCIQPNMVQSVMTEVPLVMQAILAGETLVVNDVDDLEPLDRDNFLRWGTRADLVFPLLVGGRVRGGLAFSSAQPREWPEAIVRGLRLIADVFANVLARKRADENLRQAMQEIRALKDQLQQENVYLRSEMQGHQGLGCIVSRSAVMRQTLSQVEQVAPTPASVLITGETGTGKELLAAAIHELGARRERMMIRVNCAAIPAALIESELFGREKGAYTGALARQIGRFELASGSTLFLDEIGELPLEAQAKLLRVLQEKEIERLGNPRPIKVDVRIVAATNRDLRREVAAGRFREDLFYRLNVFPIHLPPLRERREDLPQLVEYFVQEFAEAMGKPVDSIAKSSIKALLNYHWPGNIRELRNVIERSVILAHGATLRIELPNATASGTLADDPDSNALAEVERKHILSILERTGWRIRGAGGAAEILGLKPSTLESRMAKLSIRRPGSSHLDQCN